MPCTSTGLAAAMAVGGWPLFLAAGFLLVIGVMLGVLLLGIFPGGEDPG